MKRKSKAILTLVTIIIAVVMIGNYTYQYSVVPNSSQAVASAPINSISSLSSNIPVNIETEKPIVRLNNGESWVGKTTFEINQNYTSLNVVRGSSVASSVPLNILENAPMRFYVDDRGFNSTNSNLPSGISVSIQIYNKTYSPEFLSRISGPMLSKTTPIPMIVGSTSVPYTISVSNIVPPGTYLVKILCSSFLPNPVYNNTFNLEEGQWYQVTLNVT